MQQNITTPENAGSAKVDNAARTQFMHNVIAYMDECEKESSFVGFQILEERNKEDDRLLSVRLVPVDDLAGVAVPRV